MKWNKDGSPNLTGVTGGPCPKDFPLEAVQHFLQKNYGEEQGREILRKMDGLTVLKLADELKGATTTKMSKKVGEYEEYSAPKMKF